MNIKNILIRWASFMIELAASKLNKLIDILEKEVKIRRYYKQEMKYRNKQNFIDVVDEEDTSTSDDDDGEGSNNDEKPSKSDKSTMLNLVGSTNKARLSIKQTNQ
jgi:hypothetical protein